MGLIGGMARTAVVAGTATAVSNRVSRRQANRWAEKDQAAETAGTFPVTGPLFVSLLVGVILIVGALTFFPALSLGPIVEHLLMGAGRLF